MDWKPGWVTTLDGDEHVEVGKRCVWFKTTDGTTPEPYGIALALRVVGRLRSGEVVLRPEDPPAAESMFPIHQTTFKGKPVDDRACPFYWVDTQRADAEAKKIAKLTHLRVTAKDTNKTVLDAQLAETFPYQVGDLCAHEAWDLWRAVGFNEGPP